MNQSPLIADSNKIELSAREELLLAEVKRNAAQYEHKDEQMARCTLWSYTNFFFKHKFSPAEAATTVRLLLQKKLIESSLETDRLSALSAYIIPVNI